MHDTIPCPPPAFDTMLEEERTIAHWNDVFAINYERYEEPYTMTIYEPHATGENLVAEVEIVGGERLRTRIEAYEALGLRVHWERATHWDEYLCAAE